MSAIIDAVSHSKGGMTRVELAKISAVGDGEPLTKALNELEQSGFLRKYKNYTKEKQGFYFQLIDRKDGVINICEAKYTMAPFVIDAGYEEALRNKMDSFINETACKKALHLTFLSVNGLSHNNHAGIVQNEITGDELFD